MSDQHQSWLDKQMAKLIGDGDMSATRGAGQPLHLDNDTHVPDDQRLANKIMQDHNVLPAWMQMGKDLDDEQGAIRRRLRQAAKEYRGRLADARRAHDVALEDNTEKMWKFTCRRVSEDITVYNKRLLTYNISLPSNVLQRIPMNVEQEIASALRPSKTSNLSVNT
jgi:hypothetical protein